MKKAVCLIPPPACHFCPHATDAPRNRQGPSISPPTPTPTPTPPTGGKNIDITCEPLENNQIDWDCIFVSVGRHFASGARVSIQANNSSQFWLSSRFFSSVLWKCEFLSDIQVFFFFCFYGTSSSIVIGVWGRHALDDSVVCTSFKVARSRTNAFGAMSWSTFRRPL